VLGVCSMHASTAESLLTMSSCSMGPVGASPTRYRASRKNGGGGWNRGGCGVLEMERGAGKAVCMKLPQ
jgi:hypothetical protein